MKILMAPFGTHLLFLLTGMLIYIVISLTTWIVEDVIWLRLPFLVPVIFYAIGVVTFIIAGVI